MKFVSERRKFSAQYKDEAVQLVVQSGRPINSLRTQSSIAIALPVTRQPGPETSDLTTPHAYPWVQDEAYDSSRPFSIGSQIMNTVSRTEMWRGTLAISRIGIEPKEPVTLGASGSPRKTSEVADPIEAVCAVFQSGGKRVALVSLDLLYGGDCLLSRISARLPTESALEVVGIFASHTHTAPATDASKPLLGEVDSKYVEELVSTLSEALGELCAPGNGAEVELFVGSADLHLTMNRRRHWPLVVERSGGKRRFRLRGTVLAPNVGGASDNTVTVSVFRSPESGRPLAVMWNFACHPVGYPQPDRISSHFIGVVRDHLRRVFEDMELPVLFLQGFSGDVRPRAKDTLQPSISWPKRALLGPGSASFTTEGYAEWTGQLAEAVTTLALNASSPVNGSGLTAKEVRVPRRFFLEGTPSDSEVTFKSIRFGDDLLVVGASAEMVSEYAMWVRRNVTTKWTMIAGCMDDVVGYVPTERMLKEGGYEATGFCERFSARRVPAGVESAAKSGLNRVLDVT